MTIVANPRMPEILESLSRLDALTARQQSMLVMSRLLQEMFMVDEKEVRDEITHLRGIIIADQSTDQEAINLLVAVRGALMQKVAELQAQIDAGIPPTVDFAGILSDLQSIEALVVPVVVPPGDAQIPPGETPVGEEPGTATFKAP